MKKPAVYKVSWFSLSEHLMLQYRKHRASQVAQWQRICLLMQDTQEMGVRSLGWEDALEKEMATPSSILAGKKISWTEEPGGLQSMESQRLGRD